jgi:hypothetical protein
MNDEQVLAERRLRVERDGIPGLQDVALQIGFPQWTKGGDEAVCPIAIAGLYDDLPPARGRDFFEALINAARTLRQHCRNPPQGIQFFYFDDPPDDRNPYEGEPPDHDRIDAEVRRIDALHHKDWSVMVERKILTQREGSQERSEVMLQIGHPYWMIEGEMAACPVAMKGKYIDWVDHYEGRDPFEALSIAVLHVNERFQGPQGERNFFWPDGQPYGGDFDHLPPRRFERDPRSIPGNWKVVAERTLLMERKGKPKRRTIAIRIGQPYWEEEGECAACPMEIAGSYGNVGPMSGMDSYMALVFALEFFERHIRETDPDTRYFWPDGTPYEGEPLDREPSG